MAVGPAPSRAWTDPNAEADPNAGSVLGDLISTAWHIGTTPLRVAGSAVAAVGRLDRQLYAAETRPISTGGLFINPASKDFLHLSDAWRDAENVSPAQAMAANPLFLGIPGVGPAAAWARSTMGADRTAGNVLAATGFDPADPAQRLAAYGGVIDPSQVDPVTGKPITAHGSLAMKGLSGFGDAALNWYIDPLVLGGKAAKIADRAIRLNPFRTEEDIQRTVTQLEALRTGVTAGKDATDVGIGRIVATIQDINRRIPDENQRAIIISKLPFFAHSTGDAEGWGSVLSKAGDNTNDIITMLQNGMGSDAAAARLAEQSKYVAEQMSYLNPKSGYIKDSQEWFDQIPKEITNADGTTSLNFYWEQASRHMDDIHASYTDMVARDSWLRRALGNQEEGVATLTGTLGRKVGAAPEGITVPFTGGQKWGDILEAARVNVAEARTMRAIDRYDNTGHWTHSTYSHGPWGLTVRVFNWAGSEVPNGWVVLKGAKSNDSNREILAALQQARMDAPTTSKWIARYGEAVTAEEKAYVLHNMERDVLGQIAKRHLPDDPEATTYAEKLYKDFQRARTTAQDFYKEKGYAIDEENKVIKSPWADSQMAESFPLMDFRLMDNLLARDKTILRAHYGARVRVARVGGSWIGNATSNALGVFNQVWKPAVLLRLGYTVRNVGESQIAMYTMTGHFMAGLPEGTANLASNTWARLKMSQTRADTALSLKLLSDDMKTAVAQRAETARLLAETKSDLKVITEPGITPAGPSSLAQVVHTPTSGLTTPEAYYAQAATRGEQAVPSHSVQLGIASPSKPLLPAAKRRRYSQLQVAEEDGTLTPELLDEYRTLHAEAARSYIRQTYTSKKMALAYRDADGNFIVVQDVKDIPDTVLFPRSMIETEALRKENPELYAKLQLSPESAPEEAGVYVLPKFSSSAQEAISAGRTVEDSIAVQLHRKQVAPKVDRMYQTATLDLIKQGQNNLAAYDQRIEELRQGLEAKAALAERKFKTQWSKSGTLAGGQPYQAPMSDEFRAIVEKNVGMENTNLITQHTMDPANTQFALYQARYRRMQSYKEYAPDSRNYYQMLTEFGNQTVRQSRINQRILAGQTPEQIRDWLLRTEDGQGVLREIPDLGWDPEEVLKRVQSMKSIVERTYPDEQLLAMLRDGPVTETQVRARLVNRTDLVPVKGQDLKMEQPQTFVEAYDDLIQRAFKILGTDPENRMTRFPMYSRVYEDIMSREYRLAEKRLAGMSQVEANKVLAGFEANARREAAKTVRDTMYTVDRRTAPAEAVRYLMPFFQVTQNRLTYYGRQVMENPQRMARLFLGWNAIGSTKNRYGEDIVSVHIPGPVAKVLGYTPFALEPDTSLMFNKQSVNLMFQGEPWWSPGWGPVMTVPIAAIVKSSPEKIPEWLNPVVNNILPMGAGNHLYDNLLPTTARRAITYFGGLTGSNRNSVEWANSYVLIAAQEQYRFSVGLRPDPPSQGEIQRRTEALWLFRTLAAFTLPAQPTVQSPLQPMIDKYFEYQTKYKGDADAMFLQDYPSYFDYVVSLSSNPSGADGNLQAVRNAKKYNYLFDNLWNTSMVSVVTNDPADTTFSTEAYQWERNRSITSGGSEVYRGINSPEEALKQRKIARGWVEYTKARNLRDSMMTSMGVKNANDPRIAGAQAAFKSAISKINPEWQVEYAQQDYSYYGKNAADLESIVSDEQFVNDNRDHLTWIGTAQTYLTIRDGINQQLKAAAAAGGSASITAKSNAALAASWDAARKKLSDLDPQWADIAHRFFSNDNLNVIPNLEGSVA
jgi:hypothetical protein